MFWQSFSTIGSINNNKSGPSVPAGPAPINTIPNTQMPLVIIGTGTTHKYGFTTDPTLLTWESFGSFATIATPTAICCGNVDSAPLWVVIGNTGTTYHSTISTNGKDWMTSSNNISSIFTSTGWCYGLSFGYDSSGTGIFLAIGAGEGSNTSVKPTVAISHDGINWKAGGNPFPNVVGSSTVKFGNKSSYGNGYWVAVGNSGNTQTNVMYSSNISYVGNANIIWANANRTLTDPAYSVVYTGTKWLIGTKNEGNLWYSQSNLPSSVYTKFNGADSQQFPVALMSNKGNLAVIGGQGINSQYLYTRNTDTSTITGKQASTTPPSYINQIEYIQSTTMWVAAMAGTSTTANNSIAISTTAGRLVNNPWTNIQTVNTNIRLCTGVAAAR